MLRNGAAPLRDSLDRSPDLPPRRVKLAGASRVHPELRRGAEIAAWAQGGAAGEISLAGQDLAAPVGRHFDGVGEMPREMEEVLRAAGVSLFPERYKDLDTACSCPDWSNPCKHIAAVYYLLGEEFDRDPFLIFRMRGVEREEFMTLLGESGSSRRPEALSRPPERLPADPGLFWKAGTLPDDLLGEAADSAGVPRAGAAVARRLGKFPFWRGSGALQDFLEAAYDATAAKAAGMLEGK